VEMVTRFQVYPGFKRRAGTGRGAMRVCEWQPSTKKKVEVSSGAEDSRWMATDGGKADTRALVWWIRKQRQRQRRLDGGVPWLAGP
jgi:hypothetical protein